MIHILQILYVCHHLCIFKKHVYSIYIIVCVYICSMDFYDSGGTSLFVILSIFIFVVCLEKICDVGE